MSNQLVSHNVYFTLKDSSPEAVRKLLEDCQSYLKPIPGIVYFHAGTLLAEHDRDVNVRNFHVGIHATFVDKGAHDAYQDCSLHTDFVERNKDNWTDVRVFDMYMDCG